MNEKNVMVLQGGGALGAYQAGAYQKLAEAGLEPDWVAGISIGAINAAIIAGNPPAQRAAKLQEFWEKVSSGTPGLALLDGLLSRSMLAEAAATSVMVQGVPGFFRPRIVPPALRFDGSMAALSIYDISPLEGTLREVVDFDYLNRSGPRLSLGAVDVATGNFDYFDSTTVKIGPQHIMASGALPPGFPPVEIDGKLYWDGGLVSNTPLQYVLDTSDGAPLCVFQVDLFSATGPRPKTIFDVAQREKDIQFSSRTRLTTDRYRELAELRAAAERLRAKLTGNLVDDPDLTMLCEAGTGSPVMLVHLIHRQEAFEGQSKDYEFSRRSMIDHWDAGENDVMRMLKTSGWRNRVPGTAGITVLDPGQSDRLKKTRTEARR